MKKRIFNNNAPRVKSINYIFSKRKLFQLFTITTTQEEN